MSGFNLGCEKALTIWLRFEIWGIRVDVLLIWEKERAQNQVENVAKGKEEGRTLKGYFSHVVKCAIFYALLTLSTVALPSFFLLPKSNNTLLIKKSILMGAE